MSHGGQAPGGYTTNHRFAHPDPVDQPSGKQERDCRRDLRIEAKIAEILVGPAKVGRHVGLEYGNDRPVHGVEHAGNGQQHEKGPPPRGEGPDLSGLHLPVQKLNRPVTPQ